MIVNYDKENGLHTFIDKNKNAAKEIGESTKNIFDKIQKVTTPEGIKEGLVDWDNFIKKNNIADESLINFLKDTESGEKTLENYQLYLEKTSKSTRGFSGALKSFGGTAVSFLANAGASFLVEKGFELAVKGIDYLVHYQDRLIEKGEQARDSIQEQSKAYTEQKSTLGELTARYSELANGVSISGKNKTLYKLYFSSTIYRVFYALVKYRKDDYYDLVITMCICSLGIRSFCPFSCWQNRIR